MSEALTVPAGVAYDANGLVPVVVQEDSTGDVLMVAYANAEALAQTAATGEAHFWSRSRRSLWRKGETSGHLLHVLSMRVDCDGDAVLMVVDAVPPTCHRGSRSCFGETSPTTAGALGDLERAVRARAARPVEGSYTSRLLASDLDRTLKKLGEEATEIILAAKGESSERLAEEAADFLYHLVVALHRRGVPMRATLAVLKRRRAASRRP